MPSPDPQLARAARGGLCAACARARAVVAAGGTAYLRCDAPERPRYPTVPVIACDAFALRAPEPPGAGR